MVKAKEMNQINRYFPNKEMANKYEKKKKKKFTVLSYQGNAHQNYIEILLSQSKCYPEEKDTCW